MVGAITFVSTGLGAPSLVCGKEQIWVTRTLNHWRGRWSDVLCRGGYYKVTRQVGVKAGDILIVQWSIPETVGSVC